MNRRSLLFAFAVCAVLVLAGVWQLTSPKPQARIFKPAEADAFDAEHASGAAPLSANLDAPQLNDYKPQPRKLAPPPPAPTVENDPATGRIWLRLLDARNNQPVADTDCELIKVTRAGGDYQLEQPGARRFTDSAGMMPFSSGVIEGMEFEDRAEAWDVVYWDDLQRFYIPVPASWLPATSYYTIATALESLLETPSAEPLDVLVAPEATLRIVARDEWGQPLPDARIEYYVLSDGNRADSWLALREDVPPFWAPEDWPGRVEAKARSRQRSSVTAVFGNKVAEGGFSTGWVDSDSVSPPVDPEPSTRGSVLIRGLPCVRFGAIAYLDGIGFGDATIDLQPGSNELNVYLRHSGSCTLNVRVEWRGEKLEAETPPMLSLATTSPWGDCEMVEDGKGKDYYHWALEPADGNVWQGQIRNMPPGFWMVGAAFWDDSPLGVERLQLRSGETRSVTVYGGEDAVARWTPIIRLNGKQLEQCSIRILGGGSKEPQTETILHDGETTELELAAGTYTVWIPTLMPQQITLGPGETRSDAFELLCANVHFSIDAPLAELLSFEGDNVQLNLFPSDGWAEAEEHLVVIDADLRKQDEEFDQLRPGVVRVWTVPLGKYSWQLLGADQMIEGELTLSSLSESVHFGLRNMPGYELCEIEFSGFDGDLPAVDFYGDAKSEQGINAFVQSGDRYKQFNADLSDDGDDVHVLGSADRTVLYAYRERGCDQLVVYGDADYNSFLARFPGRLTIQPAQLGNHLKARLMLDAGESTPYWRVTAFHEDGTSSTAGTALDSEIEMAPGWVTIVVLREVKDWYETASVQVKLTVEPQTLDLTSLTYEPYAEVTLVFRGRGSPDSPFDAWWYGDARPAPLLLALDQSFGGSPRYVGLGDPDRIMAEGRLEFTYDNRMLPPGRYRVIPWTGAAEKYCKTFTLAAGSNSTVVVEGGS